MKTNLEPMTTVSLRADREYIHNLKNVAFTHKKKVGDIVREAVDQYLKNTLKGGAKSEN